MLYENLIFQRFINFSQLDFFLHILHCGSVDFTFQLVFIILVCWALFNCGLSDYALDSWHHAKQVLDGVFWWSVSSDCFPFLKLFSYSVIDNYIYIYECITLWLSNNVLEALHVANTRWIRKDFVGNKSFIQSCSSLLILLGNFVIFSENSIKLWS